jgi:hypothetical protein
MASQWFYQVMGEQIGPISSAELRNLAQRGTVSCDTLVKNAPDGIWIPAISINGLFPLSSRIPPALVDATANQVVPYVIRHFTEITENEIGQAERQLSGRKLYMAEECLLYALRISKCVPTLKSFKTLDSRWGIAYSGPKCTSGLINGMTSPNYQTTHDFLMNLYSERLEELCREIVAKAEKNSVTRKTTSSKCNVLYAAMDKIEQAYYQVSWVPDAWTKQRSWINYLDKKLKDLEPSKVEKGTCDGCGNWPRILTKIESGQYICRTCLREIHGSE